jgi:outer membrane protein assembly factor BamD (BamD/ComL family)
VRREPTAASQPDIALEISAVDTARTALRAGDAAGALAELDRYEGKFGRSGSLAPEAAVLRIEALLVRGDRARAKALADAFLAAHPKSPLAARVRALVP